MRCTFFAAMLGALCACTTSGDAPDNMAAANGSAASGGAGGGGGGAAGSTSSGTLTVMHLSTTSMSIGTHRPEIMLAPNGEYLVATVGPFGAGLGKHNATRLDQNLQQVGQPFAITTKSDTYGDPTDHRTAIVNGELVVVYQSIVLRDGCQPIGPAETCAKEQSLLYARLSLTGQELVRVPIVAHETDFANNNFPDHCLLWLGDKLLVSTGSLATSNAGTVRFREISLDGAVLASYAASTSTSGIGSSIGNSLLKLGEQTHMLSSALSPSGGAIMLVALGRSYAPASAKSYSVSNVEATFPTGNATYGDYVLVGYVGRQAGGDPSPEKNPYRPYLKVIHRDGAVVADIAVSQEAGAGHVHPTLVVSGSRLYYAWSKQAKSVPQVQIEQFELSP
jgi:hypothetical protein